MNLKIVIFLLCFPCFSWAQNDKVWLDSQFQFSKEQNATYFRIYGDQKGHLVGFKDFFKNGKLKRKGNCHLNNKLPEGTVIYYTISGVIQRVEECKMGKREGETKSFYNQETFALNYKNDKPISGELIKFSDPFYQLEKYLFGEKVRETYFEDNPLGTRFEIHWGSHQNQDREIYYFNSEGNEIAHLSYRDNEPWEGDEISYFLNPMQISEIKSFQGGELRRKKNLLQQSRTVHR